VTIVLVPAIVLDRDSRPVPDLTEKDFVIKEDGVPQDPFLFSLQSRKAEPKDDGSKPSPEEPEPRSNPADHSSRWTILYVTERGTGERRSDPAFEHSTQGWYLLGYIPQDKTPDGRFRRIEVEVRRDGLRVEHRRGYYAEGEREHESGPWIADADSI